MLMKIMVNITPPFITLNDIFNKLICVVKYREQFSDEKASRYRSICANKELFYPEKSIVVFKKKDEWVEDRNFTYITHNKSVDVWCSEDGIR